MVAPFGTVSVTEYVAPLKLGAGCVLGTPIVCSDSIGAIVHLGDMNDVAWVEPRGISTVSVFGGRATTISSLTGSPPRWRAVPETTSSASAPTAS